MLSEAKLSAPRLEGFRRFFKRPSRRVMIALTLGALAFGPGFFDLARIMVQQHALDSRLAELTLRKQTLMRQQERLTSDPGYVEGLIRSTFKMSQPGEYVVPLSSRCAREEKRLASE